MREDEDGFVYPVIRPESCIQCRACSEVCDYQSGKSHPSIRETYAACATNCDLRESSSGGLFAGFAKAVLDRGGIVCGCELSFEEGKARVCHSVIRDEQDLIRLKGSKYVQSDPGASYAQVEEYLNEGKEVLFCGTPCQVAGLSGYLRKDWENLYCLDFVCHGVPSRHFFQQYLEDVSRRLGEQVRSFSFRDKEEGWKLHGKMSLEDKKGGSRDVSFEPEESSYYQLFLDGLIYRENCYSCPYAGCANRPGDITIGDYWGIEIVHPELLEEAGGLFSLRDGVSVMIINTEKGKALFQASSGIAAYPSTFEKASRYNAQLLHPAERKPERDRVLQMSHRGYGEVEEWYQRRLQKIRRRRKLRARIPKWIKRAVRKIVPRN